MLALGFELGESSGAGLDVGQERGEGGIGGGEGEPVRACVEGFGDFR